MIRTPCRVMRRLVSRTWVPVAVAVLTACSTSPPPPDWQPNAQSAIVHANTAYLQGHGALADREFERARGEIAATGRVDLLARAALMHCAAHTASLQFEPCAAFERVRADAAEAERAYAAYLTGDAATDVERLPAHHRAVALASTPDAALAALQRIDEPLGRLVGAAVLLRTRRASPEVIQLAVDTASAQGWRRAVLAWLGVQAQRAEAAGDSAALARIRRRMALAGGDR